jgi:hypothetical protein
MKSGLVSLLTGESTISTLIGSRCYVGKAPQKAALPFLLITQMAAQQNTTLDGGSNLLRFIDYDIDCKADRSIGAAQLADAVRVFLDDYSGTAGSETIAAVLINDEVDDFEPPADGSDVGIHVVTLDVTIQFNP